LLGGVGASGPGFDFGACANLTFSNSVGLFMDANGNGVADLDISGSAPGADAISGSTFIGPTGGFTLEALVKFPSLTGGNREIFCMDNSGGSSARPFQFRLTSSGVLEFNNIPVAGANPKTALPATGPDAFVANEWFHVAMTYDGAGTIAFYWTRLDNTRLGAALLMTTNVATSLNLSGSAVLTFGNENRNTSAEGLTGFIDEVRVSNVARAATDMMFDTNAPSIPPSISPQPTDQFLGVGENLVIDAHASGSAPLSYQWQKGGSGIFSNLQGQTSERLSLPVTFATEGDYRFIVTNRYGQATSSVARVTVGAIFSGLFPTGFDEAGLLLANGAVDPHYRLWVSPDPAVLGPNTMAPADVLDYNANDAGSRWIAPTNTLGGVRGVYTYRATFLNDSADPLASTLSATVLSGGSLTVLLNGQSTGVSNLAPVFPGPHRVAFSFTLTNGFVAGQNALDFVVDNRTSAPNAPSGNALRVLSIRGVGRATTAPLAIIGQPADQTVRDNGRATLSCVAFGRPPLSYEWIGDGSDVPGATNRTLIYNPVQLLNQPETFTVVVRNDSSSATSRVALLTVVLANQPPTAAAPSLAGFSGAPLSLNLSTILQTATDPDGDAFSYSGFEPTGTNASSPGQISLVGVTLVYSNAAAFAGFDQFGVLLTDSLGAVARVPVSVGVSGDLRLRATPGAPGVVRILWPAAATAQGFRLLFADQVTNAFTNPVSEPIVTEGLDSSISVAGGAAARFYRLVYP
jgi:hypothetical protein